MSKRKSISLSQKVQLIKLREKEKITQRRLAERFGIGKTQVSCILSHKEKLLADFNSGCPSKRGTKLSPERLQLDKCCLEWIKGMQSRNETFTGPVLRQKAREIARKLNISNFCGSEGWLHRFRRRHGLNLKSGCKKPEMVKLDGAERNETDDDEGDEEEEEAEETDRKPSLSEVLSGFSSTKVAADDDDNSFFFQVPKQTSTRNPPPKRANPIVCAWKDVPKEINSTTDALNYMYNLKIFLKDDYAALHLATNLEAVLRHKVSLEK